MQLPRNGEASKLLTAGIQALMRRLITPTYCRLFHQPRTCDSAWQSFASTPAACLRLVQCLHGSCPLEKYYHILGIYIKPIIYTVLPYRGHARIAKRHKERSSDATQCTPPAVLFEPTSPTNEIRNRAIIRVTTPYTAVNTHTNELQQ